ncbi:hypothetical protein L3Q72_15920 [Vibrio sp. JC009]|uniref:hypothetical protein n=1 Tax=Vibrio sp. JC009 TaxID=2912314 RepID=UPI0023B15AF3|nr:hypothetical protein [Vibrio sp. JC009]WED24363.1 hypothetical protein L3Q72_15920 [Vibrio sp. JC009]
MFEITDIDFETDEFTRELEKAINEVEQHLQTTIIANTELSTEALPPESSTVEIRQ